MFANAELEVLKTYPNALLFKLTTQDMPGQKQKLNTFFHYFVRAARGRVGQITLELYLVSVFRPAQHRSKLLLRLLLP